MIRRAAGFTLVELAIGLVVIALLLSMLMVPLGTQFDQARYAEAQKHLDIAREALIGHALATGRLPCPAVGAVASTAAGAGLQSCTPGVVEGVIPWATLGIPETDAWGRRLTYRVTESFTDAPAAGTLSSFTLTQDGDITVTNGAASIATLLPAVIVSHGKNGVGAFLPDGTQIGGATGDEAQNANNNTTFVQRTHAPDFDDVVTWVSGNVLKTRMVAASRLP